jgi:hypothetical protein
MLHPLRTEWKSRRRAGGSLGPERSGGPKLPRGETRWRSQQQRAKPVAGPTTELLRRAPQSREGEATGRPTRPGTGIPLHLMKVEPHSRVARRRCRCGRQLEERSRGSNCQAVGKRDHRIRDTGHERSRPQEQGKSSTIGEAVHVSLKPEGEASPRPVPGGSGAPDTFRRTMLD